MKIIKNGWARPLITTNIWFIPSISYAIQKAAGVIRADREWIWWIGLPCVFAVWFIFNFRIVKSK